MPALSSAFVCHRTGARPLNSGVSRHNMRHRVLVPHSSHPTELRELDAVPVGQGRYRLIGKATPDDHLRFRPGEIVECGIQALPNGSHGLVALSSISSDPEYRARRRVYAVSGAIAGAVFGASAGLAFDLTSSPIVVGALVAAMAFSYASARWGDTAWETLARWI
jgi:hypothetical protein